jgi:outer membrane protein TolC
MRTKTVQLLTISVLFFTSGTASAQLGSPSGAAPVRPITLPLSGQNGTAGSATVQQSTTPSGDNTLQTSIQVTGSIQGSVAGAAPPSGPIHLTLAEAVDRGLKTNLGVLSAAHSSSAAAAQRIQALSALLPNISANASETIEQVNLAAYGFKFNLPANSGFTIPSVVGPFTFSQLQGTLSQSIYDPVARANWRTTREMEHAAELSAKDARELVVLAVAGTYLQTIATQARIESQRAQVAAAQAIYDQAQVRKTAGTNAKIDVMRTLVEFQTEQQRLRSLDADLKQQKLSLARIIGLPLDRELDLSEPLSPEIVPVPESATAVDTALKTRSDLRASEAQVTAAQRALAAARAERMPAVSLSGDYGVTGSTPIQTHGVFTVTGSVSVPIWLGGRIKGDIQQAEATLHQRESELADQRRDVEQQVRAALIKLEAAVGQLDLAQSNRTYAAETLHEASDRFHLGVATTVEVVQSQQQAAAAESDYVSSLLSLDLARLDLSRAVGQAEAALPDLLKGKRP